MCWAAKIRDEVILGIQLQAEQKNKDKMFGISLIPNKKTNFTITKHDGFVALAQDET